MIDLIFWEFCKKCKENDLKWLFVSKCKHKCLNSSLKVNKTKIGKANFCVFRLLLKYYGGSIYPTPQVNLTTLPFFFKSWLWINHFNWLNYYIILTSTFHYWKTFNWGLHISFLEYGTKCRGKKLNLPPPPTVKLKVWYWRTTYWNKYETQRSGVQYPYRLEYHKNVFWDVRIFLAGWHDISTCKMLGIIQYCPDYTEHDSSDNGVVWFGYFR